jgi:hypothetical protein
MTIIDDVNIFFTIDCTNKLLAHSDAYPSYVWKLYTQFDLTSVPSLSESLSNSYNLNCDYFQTGILYFDSSLIKETTCNDLIELSNKYFNCITNDQGIMNLYFNCSLKLWSQIPVKIDNKFLYDSMRRDPYKLNDYTMVKWL